MANFFQSFSPSFGAKTFTTEAIPGINYKAANNFNLSNIDFGKVSSLTFNPLAFTPGLDLTATGWTFITAPEDISWSINNQADRVNIFGTNNPPVVAGTKGMRDLTLGNSLVEGFVRGVTVEGKISALEKLTEYDESLSNGFVNVPVYQVWANEKAYGGGYYIIKDVKVKEAMRDLRGDATRAYVDVSFMEVPAYQVNSGRDLASKAAAAVKALALPDTNATKAQQQATQKNAVNDKMNQGLGKTKPTTGAGSASKTPAASLPTTGRQRGVSRVGGLPVPPPAPVLPPP